MSCTNSTIYQIPGPVGTNGAPGAAGANGENAFSIVLLPAVAPIALSTVLVSVDSTAWLGIGLTVFVEFWGYYEVDNIIDATTVSLKNLANAVNAPPGTVLAAGAKISPSGPSGASGSLTGAAGGQLKGNYPNPNLLVGNVKGQTLAGDGTDTIAHAPGTNGMRVVYDSAQPDGLRNDRVDLASAAEVKNALAVANGGTGGNSAATARAGILAASAGVNSDITSLTGLSVALPLTEGGTGATSAAAARAALGLTLCEAIYVLCLDQKVSGSSGGNFATGGWRTRDLNSSFDSGGISALAGNQVTLPPGTYRFRGRAPAYQVDFHQCRLQNITAGAVVAYGTTTKSAATDDSVTVSEVEGRFTIVGATAFELQHQCSATDADGFGPAGAFGNTEVYSTLEFWREVG